MHNKRLFTSDNQRNIIRSCRRRRSEMMDVDGVFAVEMLSMYISSETLEMVDKI